MPLTRRRLITYSLVAGLLAVVAVAVVLGYLFGLRPQPELEVQPSYTLETVQVGDEAKGLTTVDLNHDGTPDLIVTNQEKGTVTVLTGLGDGRKDNRLIAEVITLPAGREPRSVITGDFDADGLEDFAVVNFALPAFGNSSASVFFHLEKPDFVSRFHRVTVNVGEGPSDLVAADFNKDGFLDLAVANTFSDTISILLGGKNRDFSVAPTLPAGEGPQSIEAGDFNSDGITDLVVANLYSDDFTLFIGNGIGGFQPSVPIPPAQFPYRKFAMDLLVVDLAVGDLDHDGNLDIAWVNTERPEVNLNFGDGKGGFTRPTSLRVGAGPRSVVIADANVDGLNDVVVLNSFSDEVSLLIGLGGGMFEGPINYRVGDRPLDLAVGAFNADPGLDIFVTSGEEVFVLSSGGSPPVINAISPTRGPLAGGTILIIDGENFTPSSTVTIGGVSPTNTLVAPADTIKVVLPPGPAGPADIVVTNADGTATAVDAFTYTSGAIPELDLTFTRLVFCNAENGDTISGLDHCVLNSTKDSDVANLRGGSGLDIYAAKTIDDGGHGGHGGDGDHGHPEIDSLDEIYVNNGDIDSIAGSFVDDLGVTRNVTLKSGLFDVVSGVVTNDPAPKVQYDIQIADLDNDGDLDVVAMHTDRLRILINDGSGVFTDETSARITGFTANPDFKWDDVDIGDLDMDGDLDVIGAPRWDHYGAASEPMILLNTGAASFAANFSLLANAATAAGLSTTYASHDVELADIDGDGDLDVIFSGTETNEELRVFTNTRADTGILGFVLVYPVESSRFSPAPGTGINHVSASRPLGPGDVLHPANKRRVKPLDFNGDGSVDLYFGTEDKDQIYINRGMAAPGFFTRLENVPFPEGFTYGGSTGDFDLDGRIDIVQADYPGEPMIYLNLMTPGTDIDAINASPLPPFAAIPEPMHRLASGNVGSRRDGLVGGTYWQAVTNDTTGGLDEPDGNKDVGLAAGTKTGYLSNFSQILDVDVSDFDGDGDLDIIFSLGDHQNRANRIFLNNTLEPLIFDPCFLVTTVRLCGVVGVGVIVELVDLFWGGIIIEFDDPERIFVDPIDKNCLLKYECPGCGGAGWYCPNWYNFFFDFEEAGLDPNVLTIKLFNGAGEQVAGEAVIDRNKVLSFQPRRFMQDGVGEQLFFTFELGSKGVVGERYQVPVHLEVTGVAIVKAAPAARGFFSWLIWLIAIVSVIVVGVAVYLVAARRVRFRRA